MKEEVQKCTLFEKILLTLVWDMKGPILEHYQEKGQTVNSATYSAVLNDKLKPAICNKRRKLLSKTVLLCHDSACLHVASVLIDNSKPQI
jgi:hypothetical protein